MYNKIENEPGLVKDTKNGAVLLIDKTELNTYEAKKARMRMIHENNKKIEKLEQDISELKDMLRTLLDKK